MSVPIRQLSNCKKMLLIQPFSWGIPLQHQRLLLVKISYFIIPNVFYVHTHVLEY